MVEKKRYLINLIPHYLINFSYETVAKAIPFTKITNRTKYE